MKENQIDHSFIHSPSCMENKAYFHLQGHFKGWGEQEKRKRSRRKMIRKAPKIMDVYT